MPVEFYAACGVVALAISGLGVSNLARGSFAGGSPGRRLASALGGAAYLAAVVWLRREIAMAVLGGLTLLVIVLRLGFRRMIRGTEGKSKSQAWSQVTFAVSGTASLAVGWWLLGDRWLGFLPVAFLAWGDNAAGLVRDIWGARRAALWASAAMLAVGLSAAALVHPWWIGAAGAAAATAGERYRPPLSFWDDNLNLVAASLAVMAVLSLFA